MATGNEFQRLVPATEYALEPFIVFIRGKYFFLCQEGGDVFGGQVAPRVLISILDG